MKYDKERDNAEREGTLDEFYERMMTIEEREGRNPYNYGIAIDLSFEAEDKGEADSMSFVRYQHSNNEYGVMPWGLARVKYEVEKDELLRSVDNVKAPRLDIDGLEIPKEEPPQEVIAKRVKRFDLRWGYYFEGEWYEAVEWSADERKYRNPVEELDPEDEEYERKRREQQNKPLDGIPSYVFVTLGIADKEREKKIKNFQTLIKIPTAQENTIPLSEEEKDRIEEEEREERRLGGEPVADSR
jgi:hypothetical protein